MVKFITIALRRSRGDLKRRKLRGRCLCNVLILMFLAIILASSSDSLAQRARSEQPPPRPQQKGNSGTWFLAIVLLGLAWYPAFKNSKREMER